jgi:hypothetical protein
LLALLTGGGAELVLTPEAAAMAPLEVLEAGRRVVILQQVAGKSREEIQLLESLHALASALGAKLDEALGVVRGLEAAANDLVAASQEDFHRLLTIFLAGDPVGAATRFLTAELARRARDLLGTFAQPAAQFVDFLVRFHGASSPEEAEALRDRLIKAIVDGVIDTAAGAVEEATARTLRRGSNQPLHLPDLAAVSDSVSVDDPGQVVSAAVEVHLRHSFRGDLKISVVHDGREHVIHDRSGGAEDDLRGRFELPIFVGAAAGGTWELRIADQAAEDTGELVEWTLEVVAGGLGLP